MSAGSLNAEMEPASEPTGTGAGFILSRQFVDTADGVTLTLWLATADAPVRLIIEQQEAVCFFPERQRALLEHSLNSAGAALSQRALKSWRIAETALKNFAHEPVSALYSRSTKAMAELRRRLLAQGVELSEPDVRPSDRYLMERFVTGSLCYSPINSTRQEQASRSLLNPSVKPTEFRPKLRALSVDIETDMKAEQLYSIAAYSSSASVVFMVGDKSWRDRCAQNDESLRMEIHANERAVLTAFLEHVREIDPDVLIGWNVVNFDLRCLQQFCDRLRMPLQLGREVNGEPQTVLWREARERAGTQSRRYYATIPGRCALDGIELMRSATYTFENFSLEFVAQTLLGRGKLVEDVDNRGLAITTLFEQDKLALARYNL